MQVTVVGSRNHIDPAEVQEYLEQFEEMHGKITALVTNRSKGVANQAYLWAQDKNIKTRIEHNLIDAINCHHVELDCVIAIWDRKSIPVKNLLKVAEAANIPAVCYALKRSLERVEYHGDPESGTPAPEDEIPF